MARFDCWNCREEGDCVYRPGRPMCPRCGSGDVQISVTIAELPDDDPMWVDLRAGSDVWAKSIAAQRGKKHAS